MHTFINGQDAADVYRVANCGDHFSEYVRRTRQTAFEYCQYRGGSTTHDDLWKDRRLRIKLHSSPEAKWRDAKVVDWEEYLVGPFAPEARWAVRIEFTDIADGESESESEMELGDVVEIHGLKGAPEHNGKIASVFKRVEDTGRYGVQYGKKVALAVKATNLRRVQELELQVHRCNVEGGGIFFISDPSQRPFGPRDKISFEWLDEASPKVNVAEKPDGSPFFRPEDVTVDLSAEEIKSELAKNTRTLAIPANRCKEDHLRRAGAKCQELGELTQDSDPDSLSKFKRWLLTNPIELWGPQNLLKYLCSQLSIEAAEILLAYMESLRGTEMYRKFAREVFEESRRFGRGNIRLSGFPPEKEGFLEDPDNFHDIQMLHLTEVISVKYEKIGDYRSAIRWYEKNIQYVPTSLNNPGAPENSDRILCVSLNNLALAQKRGALFHAALENYNRAVELEGGRKFMGNRQRLEEEIEEWKGTSGRITPRLDE